MATIVGGVTTSHIPAIGNAIAQAKQNDPYWKPFFDGYGPVRAWLNEVKPDVAVIVYNDHGLNFFLDQMPTFAVGAAQVYENRDEGWGLNVLPPVTGHPALSWHLIESLVADEFDIVTCQQMNVDHGLMVPMQLLWPLDAAQGRPSESGHDAAASAWPLPVVPIVVNTVQHPLPTPRRCLALGRAIGRAVGSYGEDLKVVIIGTGGMSHQLQGERAGLINKPFDQMFMETLVTDPDRLARLSIHDLVEAAGSEGVELIMWLVKRGALGHKVSKVHSHYHVPVSSTGAGVLVLEHAA
jgi:protocatechuate 4,5-dioxygenase beta chain